jgi:hypothetical protein
MCTGGLFCPPSETTDTPSQDEILVQTIFSGLCCKDPFLLARDRSMRRFTSVMDPVAPLIDGIVPDPPIEPGEGIRIRKYTEVQVFCRLFMRASRHILSEFDRPILPQWLLVCFKTH